MPEEADIHLSRTKDVIFNNKRQYIPPMLTSLPEKQSINSGNLSHQIENSSGVFNTHS